MNLRLEQRLKRLEGSAEDDEDLELIIAFIEPDGTVAGRYRMIDEGLSRIEDGEEVGAR